MSSPIVVRGLGHGAPQMRCACCPKPVLKEYRPYPLDRSMRWCHTCRARDLNQRRAQQREAAQGLTQLAHMEDVVDPLEEDVPVVDHLSLLEEHLEPSPDTQQQRYQQQLQQHLTESNQHIHTHRWTILRASPDLQEVTVEWWERCGVSIASRKGVHWTTLRKRGPEGKKSQQRDTNTIPNSKELRVTTEMAIRKVLASIGVPTDSLHCCTIKVLRSPPGAARQKVHVDVPFDVMILDPATNQKVHKGSRCLSVVLHLNPEPTRGTHIPKATAAEMAASLEKDCSDEMFISHEMVGGDLLVFYDDVPHFGPANESDTEWRWVLFVMFSPEEPIKTASRRLSIATRGHSPPPLNWPCTTTNRLPLLPRTIPCTEDNFLSHASGDRVGQAE
jgi:hypothetical protein